jgi:hypothetical protein
LVCLSCEVWKKEDQKPASISHRFVINQWNLLYCTYSTKSAFQSIKPVDGKSIISGWEHFFKPGLSGRKASNYKDVTSFHFLIWFVLQVMHITSLPTSLHFYHHWISVVFVSFQRQGKESVHCLQSGSENFKVKKLLRSFRGKIPSLCENI